MELADEEMREEKGCTKYGKSCTVSNLFRYGVAEPKEAK